MDAQGIAERLNDAMQSDDLWSHLGIVDEVEDLADEYDRLKDENERMRELCREMFKQHQRIFHAVSPMRTSATSTQMAHWYDELWRLGVKAEG